MSARSWWISTSPVATSVKLCGRPPSAGRGRRRRCDGVVGPAGGEEEQRARQQGSTSRHGGRLEEDGVPDGDPAGLPHVGVDAEAVLGVRVTSRTASPTRSSRPTQLRSSPSMVSTRLARGSSAEQPSGTSPAAARSIAARETRCTGATPGCGARAASRTCRPTAADSDASSAPPGRAWRAPARPWPVPDGPRRRRPSTSGRRRDRSTRHRSPARPCRRGTSPDRPRAARPVRRRVRARSRRRRYPPPSGRPCGAAFTSCG